MQQDFYLKSIFLYLTYKCNLNCTFCGARKGDSNTELNFEEIRDLVIDSIPLGLNYVSITGGEPFLYNRIREICNFLIENNIRFGIATNGWFINENLDWLSKLPKKKFFIGVSLDGSNPITHDSIRGVKGAFQTTLNGIVDLAKSNIPTIIQSVLQKDNFNEILDIAKIARGYNLNYNLIPQILPKSKGKEKVSRNIGIKDVVELTKILYSFGQESGITVNVNLPPSFQPLGKSLKNSMACQWGKFFCAILPDGTVSMCHGCDEFNPKEHSIFIAGNIKNDKLSKIWTESNCFKNLRNYDTDNLKGICGKCLIRKYCRGYCRIRPYLESGDFSGPETLCEESFREGIFPKYLLYS